MPIIARRREICYYGMEKKKGAMPMRYTLIRSSRKTVAVQVRDADAVIVRAPLRMPQYAIDSFVREHMWWIEKQQAKHAARAEQPPLTDEEIGHLTAEAQRVIPARVAYFAPVVGVKCGHITIRHQKTRWGSCSSKGNLNFNCLLMLTPPEVIDSVVVHELCHLLEMNHSPRFWAQVARVMPDYARWRAWLRREGQALIGRG